MVFCPGCELTGRKPAESSPRTPTDQNSPDEPGTTDQKTDSDPAPSSGASAVELIEKPRPTSSSQLTLDIVFNILLVQTPRSERSATQALWDYYDEERIDPELLGRMRDNGFRIGLGRVEDWAAIRGILETIEDRRVNHPEPIRIPPGYPLGLELDSGPRDQTIFSVATDGVLSGTTWNESRNVLRLQYVIDPESPRRVLVELVPEVRQRLKGSEWAFTSDGLLQQSHYDGRAYAEAGILMPIESGQIVLLGPSAGDSDVYGIIGGAFLTEEILGTEYDSLVFLRPEVNYGGRDN